MGTNDDVSFGLQDLIDKFFSNANFGDLATEFEKKYEEKVDSMGCVNIIVTGRTGVGKSTLINAAFREKIAETGLGDPVTSKIRMIEKPGVPVRIYDTVGLELNQDTQKASVDEIQSLINEKMSGDPKDMIHLIWYCVLIESERFESFEENFLRGIADKGVPIIIVGTKAFDKELTNRYIANLNNRNLPIKKVMPVLSQDKVDCKAYGVDELVEYSVDLLPEAVREAWINAAMSIKLKKEKAQKIVQATMVTNFTVGFIPIPFADAGLLAATEVAMLGSIAVVYGVRMRKNELISFVSILAGVGGASMLGKTIVANLAKMIPVGGTAIGGAISGTTAAVLTFAMGEAFIALMNMITSGKIDKEQINSKESKKTIIKVFKESLKTGTKKFKNGETPF